MRGRTEGWRDGRKDGRFEIPPCVLQDIGPLGPLPKKRKERRNKGRKEGIKEGKKERIKGGRKERSKGGRKEGKKENSRKSVRWSAVPVAPM